MQEREAKYRYHAVMDAAERVDDDLSGIHEIVFSDDGTDDEAFANFCDELHRCAFYHLLVISRAGREYIFTAILVFVQFRILYLPIHLNPYEFKRHMTAIVCA